MVADDGGNYDEGFRGSLTFVVLQKAQKTRKGSKRQEEELGGGVLSKGMWSQTQQDYEKLEHWAQKRTKF